MHGNDNKDNRPGNMDRRSGARGYWHILFWFILIVVVLSVVGWFLSYEHVALGISETYAHIARLILLALGTSLVLALVHRPLRHRMELRGGMHFASTFSFFATLVVGIAAFLILLAILSIPASSFLVAVGGISIVIGFAISTITSNVISGAFMLTSFPIKIGQRIIITVNNQPGTITGIGTLFMTVTTDAGAKMIIPNAAIIQGYAFLLDAGQPSGVMNLLAKPGERVVSTLYPYPATVKQVTALFTKVVTDAGQVISIPNQAILNGATALVKLQTQEPGTPLPIAIGDEVRLSAGNFEGMVTEVGPYYFKVSGKDEEVMIPINSVSSGGVIVFRKTNSASGTNP